MIGARTVWKLWCFTGLVYALFYFLTDQATQSWIFTTLNLLTALAVLIGVRLWKPAKPAPWLLMGIGLAVYGTGKTLWFFSDPSGGSIDSLNQVANTLFAVGYLSIAVALFLMIRDRDPENAKTSMLDGAIVITGTGVFWWVFLIQPIIGDPIASGWQRAVASLYPMMDLILLGVFAGLMMTTIRRSASESMVAGGIAFMLLADWLYFWNSLGHGYSVGHAGDAGWILGFALIGAAALHPAMAREHVMVPGTHRVLSSRRLAFFAGSSLLGPVAMAFAAIFGDSLSTPAFVVSSVVLFLLVFLRLVLLLRDEENKVMQIDSKSKSLVAAEERYRTLVEQIPAVTYLHMANAHSSMIYVSPGIEDLLGFPAEEWLADPENWVKHLHPDDKARVLSEHDRKNKDGAPFRLDYRLMHRDGRVVWVTDEGRLVRDATGEPAYWQGILVDLTDRKLLEDQLGYQAFHDPLTELANRALFTDRVKHALSHRGRAVHPMAVLFVDLDDFKTINDSLGHAAGDAMLKSVAERLQGSLRLSDTAARLGGDEFGVLVEDMEEISDAERVAARILEAIERPFVIEGHEVTMRASVGIAMSKDRSATADELLRNADLAMYMAKREGAGGATVFQPQMHTAVVERLQLKADLEKALENDELRLYYQPIVELDTYRITGAEALVRWMHPSRGLVSPKDFIALAEETDLIGRIGKWVTQAACFQAREWERSGYRIGVNVNLSGRQIKGEGLVDEVADILTATGVEPRFLTFEITESALMEDVAASAELLTELKGLGVRLAVDDFGTGYSSLSYLQSFPVDILKIDRSFITKIDEGADAIALVRAVVKLGRELDLITVGEGVESARHALTLRELGCDRGQGFHFSKAVTGEGFTELLSNESLTFPGISLEDIEMNRPEAT